MRKFLITIPLIIFLLASFTFSGCINEALETTSLTSESLKSSVETSIQADNQSTETTQVKTPVVMSITPEEVYRIISAGKDHFLLDVRTPEEYSEGHIEGANLIPIDELESRLGEISRDKQIIVYCKGGSRSRTAVITLMENGFGMVYDMGGIVDWQQKGYPVIVENVTESEFKEITVDEAYQIFISDKDYLFVDVRSEDEYKSGHIEGAINIPVSEIDSRLSEIPKDKIIIVYCNGSSCNRSSAAANILLENGYTQVYNIGGEGIFEWVEKDYPTT